MTVLVHRRRTRPSVSEPKGPGGTIGPMLAPLSFVGWLSIAASVAYVGIELSRGVIVSANEIYWLGLCNVLASGCVVLLPAALELGFPGARRRNHDLFLGVTLLAIAMLAHPVTRALNHWATDLVTQGSDTWSGSPSWSDPVTALMFANQVMGIAQMIIALAGWLAIRRGLAAAGARPPGRPLAVLALVVAVGNLLIYAATYVISLSLGDPGSTPSSLAYVLAAVVNIATTVAETVVIVALLLGTRAGLLPRVAWRLGAAGAAALACGMVMFAGWLAFLALNPIGLDSTPDATFVTVGGILQNEVFWPLLFAACLAGLGRGTESRHVPPRQTYVVSGARRLRGAGA